MSKSSISAATAAANTIGMAAVVCCVLAPASGSAQSPSPALRFSGYVDADFITSFAGGGLKDPSHLTGLEIDLTTTVTFNPKLSAVIYTTMNDGVVPAQGAGNTWDGVNFDGAALNWRYDESTVIYAGDIIMGTGYFNYYLHKRSAVVVGEHTVRGAGFTRRGLTVSTGVTGLGAVDSTGAPLPTSQWSTFVKYDLALARNVTLTPSGRYTAGVPGATPFVGGLSFDGSFGSLTIGADAAINYHGSDYDPGFTFLVEPLYATERYSVAAAIFVNMKGDAARMAPNFPGQTLTGAEFDDFFVYFEPGYSINSTFGLGLPLEFHDASGNNAVLQGYDQSVWAVPTLYIYPGSGVQWWIWAQIVKPMTAPAGSTTSMAPRYLAGSEIIFRF